MKDLVKFIKESLLDMDDSNFITTSQLLEISLMELFKSLLQYTKKIHSTGNSITLIFDNKYDLNKYNDIIKSVRSDLDSIDIKYTYESGIEEQGSLKYYYNDIEFKINGFEVAMDFTYSYKKYIDLDKGPMEGPDHGLLQISVFGMKGRDFFKKVKKELK